MVQINLLLLALAGPLSSLASTVSYPFTSTYHKGSVPRTGVNLPNAEFNTNIQGGGSYNGEFPFKEDVDAWSNLGFNFIRFAFNWQFFQPDVKVDSFSSNYYQRLLSNVSYITSLGILVNIDCHMYGRFGYNSIIGEPSGPSSANFANLWSRIATDFRNNPNVTFGLMNEPHDQDEGMLLTLLQDSINAIRATGSDHYILVPSLNYSNLVAWPTHQPALASLTDPKNKLLYDIHAYFDYDSSGESGDCQAYSTRLEVLTEVTSILTQTNRYAVLSEFGGRATTACNDTVNSFLQYLDDNSNRWLGWTVWGPLLNGPNSATLGKGAPDPLYLSPDTSIQLSGPNLITQALLKHGQGRNPIDALSDGGLLLTPNMYYSLVPALLLFILL